MSISVNNVWEGCLKFIQDNISEQSFETWFLPIKPLKLNENIITIEVPSKFFYEWLEEHYISLIKSALHKTMDKDAKLVYSIVMDKRGGNTNEANSVKVPSNDKFKVSPQEVNHNFKSLKNQVKNPFVVPGIQKLKIDSQLNSNYNFDSFIEGESNRLARSAGKVVAKQPGSTSFNPLFIYGSTGTGKTHLAHAIGLEAKENHPDKTVLYVSTEKFTQQYISATKNNNRNDFLHFYQLIDVLIVDDIQFLAGKRATQDTFFHVFNELHQRGQQIVLTSDKSPVEIQGIEQRLISRFKWGLSADLQTPEYETRLKILKHKVEKDGIEVNESILKQIAHAIKTNVRELEGTLISILAQASLNKKEITEELAEKTLQNFIKNTRKEISINYIKDTVCDYFKIPLEEVQSKTRKRDVVQARQLAMFFAKKYTNSSLANIGKQIGERDHATVLHACKTVKNLSETDKVFNSYIEDLKNKIAAEN